jgi:hypothetical protein
MQRYEQTDDPNPHVRRAREIVRAHPEVTEYFGVYPATAAWIAFVVSIQLGIAYLLREASWPLVIACAWRAFATFPILQAASGFAGTLRRWRGRWSPSSALGARRPAVSTSRIVLRSISPGLA